MGIATILRRRRYRDTHDVPLPSHIKVEIDKDNEITVRGVRASKIKEQLEETLERLRRIEFVKEIKRGEPHKMSKVHRKLANKLAILEIEHYLILSLKEDEDLLILLLSI